MLHFNTEEIEKIKKKLNGYELTSFNVGLLTKRKDKILLKKIRKEISERLKLRPKIQGEDVFILIDPEKGTINVRIASVFVSGRYRKLKRGIAQTKFYCPKCKGKGCKSCNYRGKLDIDSIEELIAPFFVEMFKAKEIKFHGAGREDTDVRMLGLGRKFVIEVIKPKRRKINLQKLQNAINKKYKGRIEIFNLEYCSKKRIAEIKAEKNDKLYRAVVICESKVCSREIEKLKGKKLNIEQKTPKRVAFRRADKIRTKHVEILYANKINEKEFELILKAEAGTYIKEFISGDNSRTKPSVSSLLNKRCKCKELDVLFIYESFQN
ncbi:MAG: tRNA pseudouridine(54/55) synthase Pus10 [Candidatus Diapherotrites archaeon]|nr:tRNA pseudouridine(54/55) synthase Pus10 [Candidatus Diapherotrites archaeon]